MYRISAIAASVLSLALGGEALAAPITVADCAKPAVLDGIWLQAIAALDRGDFGAANTIGEPVVKSCSKLPPSAPMGVFVAMLSQRRGDAKGVVEILTRLPPSKVNLGSRADWMLLLAYQKLGDQAGFAAQRTKLLEAVDRALSGATGEVKGRRVERFDVGAYHVAAYEARVDQATFVRTTEFIIHTDKPLDLPTSILITRDLTAESLPTQGPKPIFVDRYTCADHTTLKILPAPVDYDQAKTQVTAFLSGDKAAVSRLEGAVGLGSCAWPSYVTPGLDPPSDQ